MNTHSVQRPTKQHKMPARRCTQNVSRRLTRTANTSDSSSPKVSKYNREVVPVDENLTTFQMSQGINRRPREKARTYPQTYEPYKHDGLENWLKNLKFPRTPQIPTVALPELQEEGEDFSYNESKLNLGGGLMGTLDGHPDAILLDCLDDILPELSTILEN
jgi:hypothetical protein